ncbi:hypothetical protein C0J52_15541 [Blattella germanica]|nr:hypothetical protein C0J52_15541 [Blattella germanica]
MISTSLRYFKATHEAALKDFQGRAARSDFSSWVRFTRIVYIIAEYVELQNFVDNLIVRIDLIEFNLVITPGHYLRIVI